MKHMDAVLSKSSAHFGLNICLYYIYIYTYINPFFIFFNLMYMFCCFVGYVDLCMYICILVKKEATKNLNIWVCRIRFRGSEFRHRDFFSSPDKTYRTLFSSWDIPVCFLYLLNQILLTSKTCEIYKPILYISIHNECLYKYVHSFRSKSC